MKNTQPQNQLRIQVLAVFAAVLVIVIALIAFMNANTDRIVAQNSQYLESSTGQTARRVDDLFTSSLESTQTAAKIYEESLTSAEVDPTYAVTVFDFSQFDQAFFVMPDGQAYNRDGRTAMAADREYYTAGIRGESGICAISNTVFDWQNVVAFYAPVRYNNEIVGILVCAYREDTLAQFMTTGFFGENTPTFLCEPDGRVIAKSASGVEDASSIEDVFAGESLNDITIGQIKQDVADGTSASFTFHSAEGIGNTYMMRLPSYNWTLVRLFPANITNGMVERANRSGAIIVAGVLIASLIVLLAFMMQARRRNRQLLLERQEATRIIDASTNLFNSLLSVDFARGTYEYLKKEGQSRSTLPDQGQYEVLCQHFSEASDAYEEGEAPLVFMSREKTAKALKEGVPYVQEEWRAKGDGQPLWYQVSTLCLARNEAGEPQAVLVAVQDVTEAKAQELASHQALEDAFQAAEHASQAKSDFLNSMSHDIRTPMNSIMGLTAIASMHVNEPDRVRDCLNNITSASKHLLGLINEVLDMAKIESGSIGLSEEPFNLPETVGNLVTIVHPQIAAKKQNLKVDMVGIKHEHVLGDPTRLQQVFVNIMGNAIKFTPDGGDITLRVAELPSRIPESGCYEFTFSDTGCGMSEEFMKTVFDPFTRANDSRTTKIEGTGLGMAIVKSVVSLMNGTVDVASKEGEGTTFTVTVHLKLRDGGEEDLAPLEGIRVLVVDDDPVACEGACLLLSEIGMVPDSELSGRDGVSAVVRAEQEGNPYRAVILDWRMPEMSGLECARAIREAAKNVVPIIILSAYDWSMIEQEAREVGVDAFISKPLYRSRLVQVMKELLTGETDAGVDEKALLEELSYAGKRVLLTEDNPMAALIAKEIVGMTGAEVEHAENGSLAVQMLRDHEPGYYDVVLMDIQMPVMNGYEAATAIRKEGENRPDLAAIPIIALSADAFAEDVKRAHASGMNDHMAKPLEIEPLTRMLKKWMP